MGGENEPGLKVLGSGAPLGLQEPRQRKACQGSRRGRAPGPSLSSLEPSALLPAWIRLRNEGAADTLGLHSQWFPLLVMSGSQRAEWQVPGVLETQEIGRLRRATMGPFLCLDLQTWGFSPENMHSVGSPSRCSRGPQGKLQELNERKCGPDCAV